MTTRTRAAGILTAITMTAFMAACSTDDNGSGDMSSTGGADAGTSSDAGGADSDGSGGSARSGAAEAPGARDVGAADDVATGSDGPSTPELERAVIASGTISLASKDVGETRRDVQRVVDAQGGEITDETTETDDEGETSYARLVVRVPSSKFGAAMEALEGAGALRASSRGSDDVTTEVIDTGVRVRAQEASLKRVELLLAEADDLKDVIWIESQLTNRQAELDSLKSQQAWLKDQTSLSTITVDIAEGQGVVEGSEEEKPAGFLAGLRSGTRAMGATVVVVATILGALLPFGVLALVLAVPVWLVVRRRRTPSPQPAAPEV